MKGQCRRFVNHKGEAYDVHTEKKKNDNIGFLDLVSVYLYWQKKHVIFA